MRAGLRWKAVLVAGGLWLMPAPALAQQTAPATTNAPATDAIGPSELQNFSLPGTKTRPADQPPATPPAATAPSRPKEPVATATEPQPAPRTTTVERPRLAQAKAPPSAPPSNAQAPLVTQVSAPPPSAPSASAPQPLEAAAAAPVPAPIGSPLPPGRSMSFLPWSIAALALAGGLLLFLWQRRPRASLADGSQFDLFVPAEPLPAPPAAPPAAPRAAPRPLPPVLPPVPQAPKPKAAGEIISSRLRPSLEIGVQPLRCVVDDSEVTIEFELDLFNAGSAPARAVLAEATLFNPGATQEQELSGLLRQPRRRRKPPRRDPAVEAHHVHQQGGRASRCDPGV